MLSLYPHFYVDLNRQGSDGEAETCRAVIAGYATTRNHTKLTVYSSIYYLIACDKIAERYNLDTHIILADAAWSGGERARGLEDDPEWRVVELFGNGSDLDHTLEGETYLYRVMTEEGEFGLMLGCDSDREHGFDLWLSMFVNKIARLQGLLTPDRITNLETIRGFDWEINEDERKYLESYGVQSLPNHWDEPLVMPDLQSLGTAVG